MKCVSTYSAAYRERKRVRGDVMEKERVRGIVKKKEIEEERG